MLGVREILDLREQTVEQLVEKLFCLFKTEDILEHPDRGIAICSLLEMKSLRERLHYYDALTAQLSRAIETESYERAAELLPKAQYFSHFFLADVPETRR